MKDKILDFKIIQMKSNIMIRKKMNSFASINKLRK